MRILFLATVLLTLYLITATHGMQLHPRPPGLRDADKQINKPLDPPVEFRPKVSDPAKLRQEAEALAQLSAGIPARMEFVAKGQLPKDLADQLKRIEKLAKHLRSEIYQ